MPFLRGAKGAALTSRQSDLLRAVFCFARVLKSAKGAARTPKQARNCFAPHSVLREFLKSRMPEARRHGFARQRGKPRGIQVASRQFPYRLPWAKF